MTQGVLLPAIAWLVVAIGGFAALAHYAATPGASGGEPPGTWPSKSAVERTPGRATLLVLLHPCCPCSRATVSELERLVARSRGAAVDVRAVLLGIDGEEATRAGERLGLRGLVAAIPGVGLVDDPDGAEIRRFRATTSGAVLLYAADGRLAFHGGITASRAHEGASFGRTCIEDLLAGRAASVHTTPVYGCALEGSCRAQDDCGDSQP